MQVKDKAIVLQCTKYDDKKYIIKLFTELHGIVTCYARVSSKYSSKIKKAAILPLTQIDVELIVKQNKDIQQLNEISCNYIYTDLNKNIKKISIAQFINEILNKTLKEHAGNAHLFEFIINSLRFLNETENNFINFHHYFIIELLSHLGIEPINNYSALNKYFDCREGRFCEHQLAFPLGLNEVQSQLLYNSLSNNIIEQTLSNTERKELLESLLAYYRFHVPGFTELKSIEVLKEVTI